ncbi:Uncharacterized protein TCM_012259 [Theobroma cacao]|uniref:Uncharacterized protein n=1 Tax=Theobroma cacao TaxID=3641 RepID=A0A061G1L4_THECC|nr:Uncharacterized protein TCM_012259 [Theobroma cacao]
MGIPPAPTNWNSPFPSSLPSPPENLGFGLTLLYQLSKLHWKNEEHRHSFANIQIQSQYPPPPSPQKKNNYTHSFCFKLKHYNSENPSLQHTPHAENPTQKKKIPAATEHQNID